MDEKHSEYLMQLWAAIGRNPRKCGAVLFPERPKGYQRAAERIANLACNLAVAGNCRREGKEESAAQYDFCAKLCVEELPPFALSVAEALKRGEKLEGIRITVEGA